MLVLTRKLQEQIRVGDDITITILRIKGNTVRVGIEAPRGVRVIRGELPSFDGEPGEVIEPEDAAAESADEPASEELEEAPLAAILRRAGGANRSVRSPANVSRAVYARA